MVAPTLFAALVTALVASQQVLANPTTSNLSALLARQAAGSPIDKSQIPAQCQSSCGSALNCGESIDCICTDKTVDAIGACLGCAANIKDSGLDTKLAQNALDAVVDGCKASGKPVKAATVSTGNSGAAPIELISSGIFAGIVSGAVVFLS